MDDKQPVIAEAEIIDIFEIKKRGLVLVLNEGFQGTIHKNDFVESERGTATITAVEMVDKKVEGKAIGYVSVIADSWAGTCLHQKSPPTK